MKKNRTMRAAVLMLALTLITSCFVGSTFAKYTTGVAASDTARVAKFGVVLTTSTNIFNNQYDNGSSDISVDSDDDTDVIAPGTKDTAFVFTISGDPEVDVEVIASLGAVTMVTLPAGTYRDYTKTDPAATFTVGVGNDYIPVKWTLKRNDAAITNSSSVQLTNVKLSVINDYLEDELSGQYDAESNEFKNNVCGTYSLTWTWDIGDGATDAADTYLGQIAAGTVSAPANHEGDEYFNFTLRVNQLDTEAAD